MRRRRQPTLSDSLNGVHMAPSYVPAAPGPETVVIVDASDSMKSANGEYNKRLDALNAIVAAHPGCTLVAFRDKPEIISSLDDLPAIERRQGAENDIAAALRFARTLSARNVIVASDAGVGIFDESWSPAQREADRLQAEGCEAISAVWMPMASAVVAAEDNLDWSIDRRGRISKADPRDYLSQSRQFMEGLVRGGGRFHNGAPHGTITNGDALLAQEFSSRNPPAAPLPSSLPEPQPDRGGGGAFFDGDAHMTIIPPAGGTMAGKRDIAPRPAPGGMRDMTAGTVSQMEQAAAAIMQYQGEALQRQEELHETLQRNTHALGQELLAGVHTQVDLNAALAELQMFQHAESVRGSLISGMKSLREGVREQGIADRVARHEENRQIEARLEGLIGDFSHAVMSTVQVEPNWRNIEAQYVAPVAAELGRAETWRSAPKQVVKQREPAKITSQRQPRFASLASAQPVERTAALAIYRRSSRG